MVRGALFQRWAVLEANASKAGIEKENFKPKFFNKVGARRPGDPDEFGALCAFLCSQQAAYITAQNILVDGGLYPGTLCCVLTPLIFERFGRVSGSSVHGTFDFLNKLILYILGNPNLLTKEGFLS